MDQGCGADSGKNLDTIQQLRIKIHEPGVVIAGADGIEAECEEIALVESEIMALKIGERAPIMSTTDAATCTTMSDSPGRCFFA